MTGPDELLAIAGISGLVSLILHRLTRHERLGGPDEGYLWYGVQEVRRRKVPLRDFRSYEPGRYWWSLPFAAVLPSEIQAIRAGATVFLGLATFALGLAVRSAGESWVVVVAVAVVPAAWGWRPHKRFDQGVVLLIAAGAIDLVRDPESTAVLLMGIVVGLALTMGANHGLYALAVAGMASLVAIRTPELDLPTAMIWGTLGTAIGLVPLVAVAVLVRGFAQAFLQRRLHEPRRRGSTNLPVKYPWLWTRGRPLRLQTAPLGQRLVTRLLFTAIPLAAAGAAVAGFAASTSWVAANAVVVGGGMATLVCWHHVASRADMSHLSTVIGLPLAIVGAIPSDSAWIEAGSTTVAIALTAVAALPFHDRAVRWRRPSDYARPDDPRVHGIWFTTAERALVDVCLGLDSSTSDRGPWLAVPMTMWILPLLGRRSAVYQTFCVYPASVEDQKEMLGQLAAQRPTVAVVGTTALDGRNELRFANTHPEVWAALHRDYVRELRTETPGVEVLVRRDQIEADST